MKKLIDLTILVLPICFAVMIIIYKANEATLSPYTIVPVGGKGECDKIPTFSQMELKSNPAIFSQGGSFTLNGDSYIFADICASGVLRIDLTGEYFDADKPILTVSIDSTVITEIEAVGRKYVIIPISKSGRLIVGYYNDYFKVNARVAFVSNITLKGTSCVSRLEIDIPIGSLAELNDRFKYLSLVSNEPVLLDACEGGQLSLSAWGVPVFDQFPQIDISQGDALIKTVETNSTPTIHTINVNPGKIALSVRNPYRKVVADPKIILNSVSFSH